MGTCNPPNYQTSARISPKYHQTPTGDDETSREVILFEVFDAALEFGYPSLVLLIQKPRSSSAKDLLELGEFLDEKVQTLINGFLDPRDPSRRPVCSLCSLFGPDHRQNLFCVVDLICLTCFLTRVCLDVMTCCGRRQPSNWQSSRVGERHIGILECALKQ